MNKLLIYLLVLYTAFSGVAIGQTNNEVDWNYDKVSLKDILTDIEASENITFSYGNVKIDKPITIAFKGKLSDGLEKLFSSENIIFKIIGDQIVLKYAPIKGEDIKGRVIDNDADYPLIGATLILIESDPLIGTTTDEDGYFRLSNLEVGRYDIKVEYIGYDSKVIPQVQVTTGKEVFLNVNLTESFLELEEVEIQAKVDQTKPINEMTTLSARSFSVEEGKRYAAAI
ncbi:MAG: carboxypeptidase-like regulatory domain-containing protein, partial [Chitinophagales bacterium]